MSVDPSACCPKSKQGVDPANTVYKDTSLRASQSTSELKVRRDASARRLRTRIILLRRAHPLRGVHGEPSTGVKVCEI